MLTSDDYLFTGLFMGEGSAMIVRRKQKNKNQTVWFYRPELGMRVRADDADMLYWIKARYGGLVMPRLLVSPTSGNPMSMWQQTGYKNVPTICATMLATGFPGKKMREVQLLLDFCNLRASMPFLLGEENRQLLQAQYEAIKVLRVYLESDQVISA